MRNIFYCPLCRHERTLHYRENLTRENYLQVAMISLVASLILYRWMSWRVFILCFIIWTLFEVVLKLRFRANLPCPHCGFDAIWYKRDIEKARAQVTDFWQKRKKT